MARKLKRWWNHENRQLRIPFNDEEGPCVLVVEPGGSITLDDRYTRYRQLPTGKIREHVDNICPQLRPDKPVEGKERKVEKVVGVDDKGYAKTKTVTEKTPAPFDEPHTIEEPPAKFNPNKRSVEADRYTG